MLNIITLLALLVTSSGSPSSLLPEERINTADGLKARVENTSGKTINALHFAVDCPRNGAIARFRFEYNFDILVNYQSDKPAPPGKFIVFALPKHALECPGGVDAVLFSDGTALGTQENIQIIRDRRIGLAKGLTEAQPLVEKVFLKRLSPDAAASEIEAQATSFSSDLSVSQQVRQGVMFAGALVANALRKEETWYLSSSHGAKGRPLVEDVMRERGFDRDQARISITISNIQQWQSDLASAGKQ